MRFATFWLVTVSLAASAIGRNLPFLPLSNISHFENDVTPRPGIGTDTPPPPGTPLSPNSPPKEETDDDEDELAPSEPASDELWNKHVRKGNSLDCGMCGTDVGAGWQLGDTRTPPSAASRWTMGVVEMVDWFWFDEGYRYPSMCEMDTFWGMESMFRGLGISTVPKSDGGDVECFQVRHGDSNAKNPDGSRKDMRFQTYEMEGREYFATDANHFFALNLREGVIIGIDLQGPIVAGEHLWGWMPKADQLPKLRNLSDTLWAYWHWHGAGRVDHLRAYVVYGIENTVTRQIVLRALRNRGRDRLDSWPGQYFPIDSTEGLALLGSPIGATIGYLLMQHKSELGNKYVSGVVIVENDQVKPDEAPDLVFYIDDVPPEKFIPDAPDQDPPQGQPQSAAAPAAPALGRLAIRTLSGHSIEQHVLGPNNILRVHTIMVY